MPRGQHSRAGWIGAGIGYCSWAAIVLLLLLVRGDVAAALEVGLPCLLTSLALWLLSLLSVQGLRLALGTEAAAVRQALFGCVLTSTGIMLWLANDAAMPALLQDAATRQLLQATGSATRLPSLLPWLLLGLGIAILLRPARALLRRPD